MIRLWSIPPRWKIPVRFFGNKASEGRLGKITYFAELPLVTRLLSSPGFIPELSLTAWIQNELVGYILLTEIEILSDSTSMPSLSLAPLAVRPKFQKQGIGAALIKEAHKRACQLNYETILVLGHKDYYPRFGYKKAENFGITFPFEVQPEFCMVKELTPGAASRAAGQVKYPKAFFEY